MSTVIAISNQKGGVGKTTTAINLAAYLAKTGRSVILIDLDPQANATSGSGVDKGSVQRSIYQALFEPEGLEHVVLDTPHGYALMPAQPELASAEVELAAIANREFALQRVLNVLAHDFVIIDCPPALGLLTVNALSAADHVIIPVQAEYYALEGLGQLLETVGRIQQALNPRLNILGVLLTMHSSRTSLAAQVDGEVRRHFGPRVFDAVIPRNVRLAEAPSFGVPIAVHDKWSKGARSYKQLAREVERRVERHRQGVIS